MADVGHEQLMTSTTIETHPPRIAQTDRINLSTLIRPLKRIVSWNGIRLTLMDIDPQNFPQKITQILTVADVRVTQTSSIGIATVTGRDVEKPILWTKSQGPSIMVEIRLVKGQEDSLTSRIHQLRIVLIDGKFRDARGMVPFLICMGAQWGAIIHINFSGAQKIRMGSKPQDTTLIKSGIQLSDPVGDGEKRLSSLNPCRVDKTEGPDLIGDHHGSLPIIERGEGNRRGKTARMQFQRHTGVGFIAEGVSREGEEGMQQQAKEKGWQPCRWRDVRGGHVIGLHMG